jgi:photosystem II stability/assembly factor-like uncharacterized protein
MRRLAISIVISLLVMPFVNLSAATAAPGATLSVGTQSDVTNMGPETFATLAASSDGSKIIAGVNGGKAYRSVDYGKTWSVLTGLTALVATASWNASASSADGSVLYIAAYGGFVYRSQDSGATFTQIGTSRNWFQISTSSDGQIFYGAVGTTELLRSTNFGTTMTSISITSYTDNVASSADGQIVYIAQAGLSIAKSTDGGLTFTPTGSAATGWRWLATDSTGTRVLAAPWASGTLYVSTDSGTTFTSVASAGTRQWIGLSVSGDGSKMLAGVRGGGVVMKSLDSGATWSVVSGNSGLISYASDISTDGTRFFLSAARGITLRSSDSGATFSTPGVLPRIPSGYLQNTISWSADGARAAALFCRSGAVCYVVTSPDGGQNFFFNLELGGQPDNSTLSMAANGQNIVVHNANTFNFAVSTNFGATWSVTTNPSTSAASWATMAMSADGTKIVVAEDQGVLLHSSDSGATFTVANSTVSRWLYPSMNSDGSVILVNGYPNGVFRSTNNGATWTNVQPMGSGDLQWTAIAASGNTAVVSNWAGKLWISQDKGLTWATTSTSSTSNFNTVSISADGSAIFASSFDNHIDYSLDSGATFSTLNSAGLSDVSALAISQDARKLMYVTSSTPSMGDLLFVASITITQAAPAEFLGPLVSNIDKRKPTPGGGETISITGRNLHNVTVLKVGGNDVAIKSQSSSTLTFTAPSRAVGSASIYLANANGILTFADALTYTKVAAELPKVPTTVKLGKSLTLKAADSRFLPTLRTSTPAICSVSGLKVTAKRTGKCMVSVRISVPADDSATSPNSASFAIQVRR